MQNFFSNKIQDFDSYQNTASSSDLIRIRKDIIGELEAINQYQEHADATNNQLIKKVLISIRKEEEVHVGELISLLFTLDSEAKNQFEIGVKEFEKMK